VKKVWCIYGWFLGCWNMGKVEEDHGRTLVIRYSEGQLYPCELWEATWVSRFDTIEEMIKEFSKKKPVGIIEAKDSAKRKFPGAFCEE
jgi:hypothetical protein